MNFVSIQFVFTIGTLDLTLCVSHALRFFKWLLIFEIQMLGSCISNQDLKTALTLKRVLEHFYFFLLDYFMTQVWKSPVNIMREGSAKMNNMYPRLQSEMPKLVTRSQSSNALPKYLLRIQIRWGPQFRLVMKSLCSDYLQSDVGLIFVRISQSKTFF